MHVRSILIFRPFLIDWLNDAAVWVNLVGLELFDLLVSDPILELLMNCYVSCLFLGLLLSFPETLNRLGFIFTHSLKRKLD